MSRITSVFTKSGHKALIPYITVGYPSLEASSEAVLLLAASGADIIELGIPFSDPLADGATIQESSYQALQNGITPEICLEAARKLREKTEVPLVFMTYFNPVLNYGLDEFCHDSASAGIDGLIVPDLPPDEGSALVNISMKHSLDMIFLLSPNSTEQRIQLVSQKSRGFIYLVSVTGVTGPREVLSPGLEEIIGKVRQISKQPLCVGFGISTAEQAKKIAGLADGIIIGSKLIQLMNADRSLHSLQSFIQEIRAGLD